MYTDLTGKINVYIYIYMRELYLEGTIKTLNLTDEIEFLNFSQIDLKREYAHTHYTLLDVHK